MCACSLSVTANAWQLLLPVVGIAAVPWIAQFLRGGRRDSETGGSGRSVGPARSTASSVSVARTTCPWPQSQPSRASVPTGLVVVDRNLPSAPFSGGGIRSRAQDVGCHDDGRHAVCCGSGFTTDRCVGIELGSHALLPGEGSVDIDGRCDSTGLSWGTMGGGKRVDTRRDAGDATPPSPPGQCWGWGWALLAWPLSGASGLPATPADDCGRPGRPAQLVGGADRVNGRRGYPSVQAGGGSGLRAGAFSRLGVGARRVRRHGRLPGDGVTTVPGG